MLRWHLVALALVLGLGACTEETSTYCDGDHGCTNPALPRCDYATRTCRPPDDGGALDGGTADAPTDGNGADAGCTSSSACLESAAPICAAGACRACASPAECSARDPAAPGCAADGRCVACVGSTDCPNAATPICASETCRGCQNAAECAARSTATPACHADGRCVECRANLDCASQTDTPACDLATSTCVPCTSDDQCSYFCDATTGRCATTAEITFVDKAGPSCASAGTGAGTLADPFCEIKTAVANLGSARFVYVRPGSYQGVIANGPSFRLRAEAGAMITSTTGTACFGVGFGSTVEVVGLRIAGGGLSKAGFAVSNSAGKLTLRGVRAENLGDYGVRCDTGGTLVMDRSEVLHNTRGGLYLSDCAFTVTNSVIAENGSATAPFGGVYIETAHAGASFVNNTVVSNHATTGTVAGILCATAAQVVNSVVWFNDPPQVTNPSCAVIYSNVAQSGLGGVGNINAAPSFVSLVSGNYHYAPGSPGIDVATATVAPDHDFDGYPRPYGGAPDMGAFEWHP
ncbi:MAG TPA: right-handed parallel beta-helix repeat-containing protein [Polyangia bacterium]